MAYETADEIIAAASESRGDAVRTELVFGVGPDIGEHIELQNPACYRECERLLGEGAVYLGSIAFFKTASPQDDDSTIYNLRSEIKLTVPERKDDMQQLERYLSEQLQRDWLGVLPRWDRTEGENHKEDAK